MTNLFLEDCDDLVFKKTIFLFFFPFMKALVSTQKIGPCATFNPRWKNLKSGNHVDSHSCFPTYKPALAVVRTDIQLYRIGDKDEIRELSQPKYVK